MAKKSWLELFDKYTSSGEAPAKLMYWVGVSTLAGALQRKVWIEQGVFQWCPNFFILLVAPPNAVHKSTSITMGMKLLKAVQREGITIDFGPQATTWQQLITHMAENTQNSTLPDGRLFSHSSTTVELSEFGSFFDAQDRPMVDALTQLWDAQLGVYRKETKTNGCDEVVNPWLNMIACTTPSWMKKNFTADLIGQGIGSRIVFLYANAPERLVAYPSRQGAMSQEVKAMKTELIARLTEIAGLAGPMVLSDAAYEWGEEWYEEHMAQQAEMGDTQEAGFRDRWQAQLHKLAMIISVSRGQFPKISLEVLMEARDKLMELDKDSSNVFDFVGKTAESDLSQRIISEIRVAKSISKGLLYRTRFFPKVSIEEYEKAMLSVLASKEIVEVEERLQPMFFN